eukprot:7845804-Prorocentrum_lima.AAC.1
MTRPQSSQTCKVVGTFIPSGLPAQSFWLMRRRFSLISSSLRTQAFKTNSSSHRRRLIGGSELLETSFQARRKEAFTQRLITTLNQ